MKRPPPLSVAVQSKPDYWLRRLRELQHQTDYYAMAEELAAMTRQMWGVPHERTVADRLKKQQLEKDS